MHTTGQMVIANRLTDGRTVFMAADGGWTDCIASGAFTADKAAAQQLLAAAQADEGRNRVVEPALITVADKGGHRRPVEFREAIRAAGPTLGPDRQA